MIQAIIFDIEGTFTNLDKAKFMQNYLGILAPRFAHLLSPDKFSKQLLKSLDTILKDPRPEQTVMQTFFEDFSKATGQSMQTLKPIFDEFYASDFPALRCLVNPDPQGVKAVEIAIQQGFLTAIVSNALMPITAIKEQVRWAGLTPEHFKVITSLETLHYFKSQLSFFREIAEVLGVRPESCLWVSKHIKDRICQDIGMKMYLAGTSDDDDEFQADYAGPLEDLVQLISDGRL